MAYDIEAAQRDWRRALERAGYAVANGPEQGVLSATKKLESGWRVVLITIDPHGGLIDVHVTRRCFSGTDPDKFLSILASV